MRWCPQLVCLVVTSAVVADDPPPRKHSNIQRLSPERLAAVHLDVAKIKLQRVEIVSRSSLTDYRCILHAHAEDSDHTGGTVKEMLADAKKAGVHAILLTDHYRPPADFIDGRWRGLKDGVLFIPGAEVNGFLIYPTKSILNRMELKGADFVNTVNVDDGLIFLSHIEERKDHSVDGLTGLEIYNRHWDAKRDKGSFLVLAQMLTDPKRLADLEKALRLYPDKRGVGVSVRLPGGLPEEMGRGHAAEAVNRASPPTIATTIRFFLVKMVDATTVTAGHERRCGRQDAEDHGRLATRNQGDDERPQSGRCPCARLRPVLPVVPQRQPARFRAETGRVRASGP